jgi:hypothetical protein
MWEHVDKVFDRGNMAGQEKRSEERYSLELTSTVTWEDKRRNMMVVRGKIKNVSPSGAFLVCASPIGEGRIIDLQIDLPFVAGSFIRSRIFASVRVVRNGFMSQGLYGYGIKLAHLSFARLDKS